MVIHKSKFKKTLGHIARGKVCHSEKDLFIVYRNIRKFNEKQKLEEKIHTRYFFRNKKDNYYQKPEPPAEVLMRYHDSKSKQALYKDSEKNYPFEVLTLKGELIYRKNTNS